MLHRRLDDRDVPMTDWLFDAAFLIGVGIVVYACWTIAPFVGLLVMGAVLVAIAIVHERNQP